MVYNGPEYENHQDIIMEDPSEIGFRVENSRKLAVAITLCALGGLVAFILYYSDMVLEQYEHWGGFF